MSTIILKRALASLVFGTLTWGDIQSAELPQMTADQILSKGEITGDQLLSQAELNESLRRLNAEQAHQFEIVHTALSTLRTNFKKMVNGCEDELKLIGEGENETDVSKIQSMTKDVLKQYDEEEQAILNSLLNLSKAHTDVSQALFEIQSTSLQLPTEKKNNNSGFLTWLQSFLP